MRTSPLVRIVSALVAPVVLLEVGSASANTDAPGDFHPGELVPSADSAPVMFLAFDMRTLETISELIRYEATEAQRKAALERASAYCAHLSPERRLAIKKKKVSYLAVPVPRSDHTSRSAKAVVMIVKVQADTKEDTVTKAPPATKTVPEAKTSTEAKAPSNTKDYHGVETLSRSLINNDAYELPVVPTAGTTQKFDTITAEYIGK